MHKVFLSLSLFSVISISPVTGAAENRIRPGLWEVTTSSMLLALVPRMPPEQMQQLTDIAKQYGLDLPRIHDGAATSRVCITQQMAEQEIPSYFYAAQAGCSVENGTRIENTYKMDLACSHPELRGNGKAEGTFTTPETFSGWTTFSGTLQGRPVSEQADTSARWVSPTCASGKKL